MEKSGKIVKRACSFIRYLRVYLLSRLADINNLCNYFNLHICLNVRLSRHTSNSYKFITKLGIKSCLLCVKSEKYTSWVVLRPKWDCCRQGEAEVRILDFKTTWSKFHKGSFTYYVTQVGWVGG